MKGTETCYLKLTASIMRAAENLAKAPSDLCGGEAAGYRLLCAFDRYMRTNEEPDFEEAPYLFKVLFDSQREHIDKMREGYKKACSRARENGVKGGRPKKAGGEYANEDNQGAGGGACQTDCIRADKERRFAALASTDATLYSRVAKYCDKGNFAISLKRLAEQNIAAGAYSQNAAVFQDRYLERVQTGGIP